MIAALIAIALKSLVVAGATLGLLRLMHRRSAAERSWVAHVGLVALVLLAFAPLVMPSWTVETPAFFASAGDAAAPVPATTEPAARTAASSVPTAMPAQPEPAPLLSRQLLAAALYGLPAAFLLFVTALALGRLIALRARADVLVDGHWLSALARAQRRMGFKHGTALLTSDDLASPISWGLMRPVILLNNRAVEAAGEAEAIIAHELAHVAHVDWAKLLLARVATALFWFNPLVWALAREAHQLREETADDAVLAADIVDTDYAQLLVGVARHDCPGMLLGAHGVAPSRSSLGRRIARVLDHRSVRGPAARPFALGVFAGALLVSAPLAALTLIPKSATASAEVEKPALAKILATGVQASVDSAVLAVAPPEPVSVAATVEAARISAQAATEAAVAAARSRAIAAATASAVANGRTYPEGEDGRNVEVELRAVGASPDYLRAMRAASPALARADKDEFVALRAVGVTPAYVREMSAVGLGNIDADELVSARATGLTASYVRAMRAEGVRGDVDEFVQLFVIGIKPSFVRQLRRRGVNVADADQLRENWPLGPDFNASIQRQVQHGPPARFNPPALPVPPPELPDSDPE